MAVAISKAVLLSGPQFTLVSGNSSVNLETKDLRPGEVRFYIYQDRSGDKIRFLLARDSAGRVKAAFDACDRCYIYHRGYLNSAGELIRRF